MEETNKVSVIMAIYNCKDTLSESIESILGQTYENWELIICDDASTDGSYEMARWYEKKYPNKFKVVRNKQNSKLPFSLNHCLRYVTGKYVARMDGDDISLPERFEKQVNYLENHPELDVVGTSMISFDENGDYRTFVAARNPDKYILRKEVPFCHATIMMRKKVYDVLEGYTISSRTERGQDVDLWFRFFAKGFRGDNLVEPLYRVREDRCALKRRKLKYALYCTETKYIGFRLVKMPIKYYPFILTPIISFCIPRKFKMVISEYIHKR